MSAASPEQGTMGREEIARLVFDAMAWGAKYQLGFIGHQWVERGNSFAQDEARRISDAILALRPSASTGSEYQRGIEDAAKVLTDGAITEGWARANDVREILESYARQIRALTPSPGVAEVERLREALLTIQCLKRSIMIDVGSCHSNRGTGASSAMREDDSDLRRDIEEAFAKIDAALSVVPEVAK